MGWLDATVGALQSGYVPGMGASPFPDYVPPAPPLEGQALWDKIAADEAAANTGADRRNLAGMTRAPIVNPASALSALSEPAISMALGGGMQPPANPSAPFGAVPPSLMMAKAETAPPDQAQAMDGPVPMPQPRPAAADAPPSTDVSSRGRPPVAAPMGLAPPMAAPPVVPRAAPEPSFGDRMKGWAPALLAAGSAFQGDNSVAAGMMKQREALALQSQQANATARFLSAKGAQPAEIQAAVLGGPETLKALLSQYTGKDKFSVVQTGETEDQYGGKRKIFQVFNSNDGTVKDIAADSPEAARAQANVTAPDLTDAQKNRVQAIIEGREPYPAMSRASDAARIRAAVHEADPTFDAVNYTSRLKARQSFTSGKDRANLTSFNTTIGHLEELQKAADDLRNSGFPAWNKYIANPIAEQFDPKFQAALKRFQAARTAVSDELTRAFRGSGGNVHDIIQWENAINSSDAPDAIQSAVRTAANLLESRIQAVGDSYNAAMGTTKDPLALLSPHAQEAFNHLKAGTRSGAAAPAKSAAPVKPGAYVWDPVKGLVPK